MLAFIQCITKILESSKSYTYKIYVGNIGAYPRQTSIIMCNEYHPVIHYIRATLFILFSVASQIRLLLETRNYTKQIFVHTSTIDVNYRELQCVQRTAVRWIELESHRFLC
jgi:hypothetical protein